MYISTICKSKVLMSCRICSIKITINIVGSFCMRPYNKPINLYVITSYFSKNPKPVSIEALDRILKNTRG